MESNFPVLRSQNGIPQRTYQPLLLIQRFFSLTYCYFRRLIYFLPTTVAQKHALIAPILITSLNFYSSVLPSAIYILFVYYL